MLLAYVVLNELEELYNGTVANGQVEGLVELPVPDSISHLNDVIGAGVGVGVGVGVNVHPVHASDLLVIEWHNSALVDSL